MSSPTHNSKDNSEAAARRKAIYSHPSSKDRRAEAARVPGPEAEIANRHQHDKQKLVDKHRAELKTVDQRHRQAEQDHARHSSANFPEKQTKAHQAERRTMVEKHAMDLAELVKGHRAEVKEYRDRPRGTWGASSKR